MKITVYCNANISSTFHSHMQHYFTIFVVISTINHELSQFSYPNC